MERYGDPGFHYHVAAARFFGLTAMRLATAEVLPFRFGDYAGALREQLDDLRRRAVREAREPESGEKPPLAADFGPLLAALEDFGRAGARLDEALEGIRARGDAEAAGRVNGALIEIERAFLSDDGLPQRPWFRHLIYAPGLTTGYAPWPFPELTQAVEDRDPALFERGMERVLAALAETTRRLERAAAQAR